MIKLTIILIIVILVLLCVLTLLSLIGRLSYLNKKVLYADKLIEENIDKKVKQLTKLNASIKKVLRAKKYYLSDLDNINNEGLSNHDKDIQLSQYDTTVNNLMNDYTKLANNKDINKQVSSLVELNEKNAATKEYFNKYTLKLSELIKKFPNNILSKFMKIKIIPLYETSENINTKSDENL